MVKRHVWLNVVSFLAGCAVTAGVLVPIMKKVSEREKRLAVDKAIIRNDVVGLLFREPWLFTPAMFAPDEGVHWYRLRYNGRSGDRYYWVTPSGEKVGIGIRWIKIREVKGEKWAVVGLSDVKWWEAPEVIRAITPYPGDTLIYRFLRDQGRWVPVVDSVYPSAWSVFWYYAGKSGSRKLPDRHLLTEIVRLTVIDWAIEGDLKRNAARIWAAVAGRAPEGPVHVSSGIVRSVHCYAIRAGSGMVALMPFVELTPSGQLGEYYYRVPDLVNPDLASHAVLVPRPAPPWFDFREAAEKANPGQFTFEYPRSIFSTRPFGEWDGGKPQGYGIVYRAFLSGSKPDQRAEKAVCFWYAVDPRRGVGLSRLQVKEPGAKELEADIPFTPTWHSMIGGLELPYDYPGVLDSDCGDDDNG